MDIRSSNTGRCFYPSDDEEEEVPHCRPILTRQNAYCSDLDEIEVNLKAWEEWLQSNQE